LAELAHSWHTDPVAKLGAPGGPDAHEALQRAAGLPPGPLQPEPNQVPKRIAKRSGPLRPHIGHRDE